MESTAFPTAKNRGPEVISRTARQIKERLDEVGTVSERLIRPFEHLNHKYRIKKMYYIIMNEVLRLHFQRNKNRFVIHCTCNSQELNFIIC